MIESGLFYSTVIDPILAPLRKRVSAEIKPNGKILDIACGTGTQLFEIAKTASFVTGIDLSESMINFATETSRKQNILNAAFFVCDASELSIFKEKRFDAALMTLALHQFPPHLYFPILNEMKRVANKIIIVDYAVPLPKNVAGIGSRVAEFFAGMEHNRNFKHYCKLGGLNKILPANNLTIRKSRFLAEGAFQLVVCDTSEVNGL